MAQFIFISIILSIILVVNSAKIPETNLNATLLVVNSLEDFLMENPQIELLQPLIKETSFKEKGTYTLGIREDSK